MVYLWVWLHLPELSARIKMQKFSKWPIRKNFHPWKFHAILWYHFSVSFGLPLVFEWPYHKVLEHLAKVPWLQIYNKIVGKNFSLRNVRWCRGGVVCGYGFSKNEIVFSFATAEWIGLGLLLGGFSYLQCTVCCPSRQIALGCGILAPVLASLWCLQTANFVVDRGSRPEHSQITWWWYMSIIVRSL